MDIWIYLDNVDAFASTVSVQLVYSQQQGQVHGGNGDIGSSGQVVVGGVHYTTPNPHQHRIGNDTLYIYSTLVS